LAIGIAIVIVIVLFNCFMEPISWSMTIIANHCFLIATSFCFVVNVISPSPKINTFSDNTLSWELWVACFHLNKAKQNYRCGSSHQNPVFTFILFIFITHKFMA
jgi:hypothetical protein